MKHPPMTLVALLLLLAGCGTVQTGRTANPETIPWPASSSPILSTRALEYRMIPTR
jgi:hypothetical protein